MILHVACLPFPSFQGTQAAIAAMLEASVQAGRTTQLLAYTHAAYQHDAPYEIRRIPDFPRVRSLRSGPSWGKIALDLRCVVETRRLARNLQASAIIAHHVEAALAALAAQVAPVYYIAHTSLERELPVYFPSLPSRLVSGAAAQVERVLRTRTAGIAAVAPSLARLLGDGVEYLPVPWTPSATLPPKREEARAMLGLARDAEVCLYAGNLDRYQGWELLIEALAILRRRRPNARLLLATESDPAPARLEARRQGVSESLDFCRINGESARALAHSASDLTWIPRRTEGGLPIKMLDAFSRALPVVAMERATASLSVESACIGVQNDDAGALAVGATRLLEEHRAGTAICDAARRYLGTEHSPRAFNAALHRLLGSDDSNADQKNDPAHRARALSTYAPTRGFLDPS